MTGEEDKQAMTDGMVKAFLATLAGDHAERLRILDTLTVDQLCTLRATGRSLGEAAHAAAVLKGWTP
jgi:hypothetical protein